MLSERTTRPRKSSTEDVLPFPDITLIEASRANSSETVVTRETEYESGPEPLTELKSRLRKFVNAKNLFVEMEQDEKAKVVNAKNLFVEMEQEEKAKEIDKEDDILPFVERYRLTESPREIKGPVPVVTRLPSVPMNDSRVAGVLREEILALEAKHRLQMERLVYEKERVHLQNVSEVTEVHQRREREWEDQKSRMRLEVNRAKKDAEVLRRENRDQQLNIERLTSNLDSAKSDVEKLTASSVPKTEVIDLELKNSRLETRLREEGLRSKQLQTLRTQNFELKARCDEMESEMDGMVADRDDLRQQVVSLEGDKHWRLSRDSQLLKLKAELSEHCEREVEIDNLNSKMEAREADVAKLVVGLKEIHRKAVDEIGEQRRVTESVEGRLAIEQTQCEVLRRELERCRSQGEKMAKWAGDVHRLMR